MSDSAKSRPIGGACLCGAVQFEIELPSESCGHCHCSMCRRSHGAGFVTWVIVPTSRLRTTAGEDRLVRYQSSDHGGRHFCRVCGSSLFGDSSRTPELMYVTRANLVGEIDRAPEFNACYSDRASWVDVDESLLRLDDAGVLTTEPE